MMRVPWLCVENMVSATELRMGSYDAKHCNKNRKKALSTLGSSV